MGLFTEYLVALCRFSTSAFVWDVGILKWKASENNDAPLLQHASLTNPRAHDVLPPSVRRHSGNDGHQETHFTSFLDNIIQGQGKLTNVQTEHAVFADIYAGTTSIIPASESVFAVIFYRRF